MAEADAAPSGFRPAPGLGSPHLQSLLNSSALRGRLIRRRARALVAAEQEWLMDGGAGVRLIGHYSAQPGERLGVAVLLHGWEGSSRSNYMLATGARLYAEGFDVFRLNLRDHGDSHHLNPGIFHSCRLDEVLQALGDFQQRAETPRWAIAGFSLGGNFALRVALRGPARGLGVARAVAVCPVIDPANALVAMEQGPAFYHDYYNRKWGRSLRKKQRHYPDDYDYEAWFALKSMREKTRFFATQYYDFPSLESYFDGYSVAGDRLAALSVPCAILTASDDPVIPVADAGNLAANANLELTITARGGHCGYIKNWKLESWAEDFIAARLLEHAAGAVESA